jgi:hypothetical protein
MFIVTATIVKPVSRDELPAMRGIDGLKGNSPLGVEPRGEGIQGQSGFKVSGQNEVTPQTEPTKKEEAKPKATDSNSGTTNTGSASSTRVINPSLPAPRALNFALNLTPEPIRP